MHECFAGERAFVVMVAEYGCVGYFVFDEEMGEFENGGLSVWGCFAIDLVAGKDD